MSKGYNFLNYILQRGQIDIALNIPNILVLVQRRKGNGRNNFVYPDIRITKFYYGCTIIILTIKGDTYVLP